ncbi:uncharacterized protein LOC113404891 [Vanessa tameamea]|uniref:Uncharacterized protein LOC113404891 n=1 Tax=Vanessa tameamea TaxID=334116 RepID=A0A8B8IZ47_VANTA|nr:uncharacterized protein LOC113404891 [Vanessa tameamea]
MDNYQKQPLKLYVQDIFRAKRTEGNKYIYEIFGIKFKNIMIHGVVTSMYNTTTKSTNFEISDPTGCVQVYYDSTKNNTAVSDATMKDLVKNLSIISRRGDDNAPTMAALLNSIEKKHFNSFDFVEGSNVSVIGDIFIDDLKNTRMLSAYQCKTTTVERDIVWLEELKYIYNKYYIPNMDLKQ